MKVFAISTSHNATASIRIGNKVYPIDLASLLKTEGIGFR